MRYRSGVRMRSRNAHRGGFVAGSICPRCDRRWRYFQTIDDDGRAIGSPRPIIPHCTSCCSNRHWACVECGRCLPPYRGALENRARIDRRTCSAGCRQRAYRRREKARREADALDTARIENKPEQAMGAL